MTISPFIYENVSICFDAKNERSVFAERELINSHLVGSIGVQHTPTTQVSECLFELI